MGSQFLGKMFEAISEKLQGFIAGESSKKISDERLKKQFEELGDFIIRFVNQDVQDEFSQGLMQMFSKDEMDQLYINLSETPGFVWKKELEKQLQKLCNNYGVTFHDAQKFIDNFLEMVYYSLSRYDEEKAMQMFCGASYVEIKERLEKIQQSGDDQGIMLKKVLEILLSWSDNAKERKNPFEDSDIEQNKENQQMDDQSKDNGQSIDTEDISENESDSEVVWDICYKHREGLFGKTEGRREDMCALTVQWREERMQYPNWFILPAKLRDRESV